MKNRKNKKAYKRVQKTEMKKIKGGVGETYNAYKRTGGATFIAEGLSIRARGGFKR